MSLFEKAKESAPGRLAAGRAAGLRHGPHWCLAREGALAGLFCLSPSLLMHLGNACSGHQYLAELGQRREASRPRGRAVCAVERQLGEQTGSVS